MLEARFQKVLQIQREIYAGTVHLDKTPLPTVHTPSRSIPVG